MGRTSDFHLLPNQRARSRHKIAGTCWHNWKCNCVENVILLEYMNMPAMIKEAEEKVTALILELSTTTIL